MTGTNSNKWLKKLRFNKCDGRKKSFFKFFSYGYKILDKKFFKITNLQNISKNCKNYKGVKKILYINFAKIHDKNGIIYDNRFLGFCYKRDIKKWTSKKRKTIEIQKNRDYKYGVF